MSITDVTSLPAGSRVYLDTNVWIYALEGFPAYIQALQHLCARIDSGELRAITSELTLAETLVKPLSLSNAALVQTYSDTLQSSDFLTIAPVSREILIEACPHAGAAHSIEVAGCAACGIGYCVPSEFLHQQ